MAQTGSAATLDAIRAVVALLSVAALAALVVARLRIPYSVTLVVLGLAAGALLPRGTIEVTPQLVLLVLVPGLVFEAALRLDLEHLRRTFGWIASRLMALVDDLAIELTISIAAAYGTYLLADGLGQSGIIATVVAGVVIGTYGRAVGLSPRALEALDVVWELIAFLLTAFAFLLVGLAISVGDLLGGAASIFWGVVGIVVARVVVVYGLLGGIARVIGERAHWPKPPIGWLHVMFWAGLRGAVAVAMALSLPADFPQRALLQEVTFGVVLFTLFVQGTTAELVVARTGARAPAQEPAAPS